MGQYLTINVGTGVEVPIGDDSEFEFNPDLYKELGLDEDDDWYDVLTAITRKFNLLDYDISGVNEYTFTAFLFFKGTGVVYFSASGVIDLRKFENYTPEEENQLKEACKILGIEYNPQPYVSGSFG